MDQVQGSMMEAAGIVQRTLARAVGSTRHHARGNCRVTLGQARRVYGDAKQIIKNATRKT